MSAKAASIQPGWLSIVYRTLVTIADTEPLTNRRAVELAWKARLCDPQSGHG